ncbi:hypothetical protein AYO21_08475 [Fonsecaea monophora]|uniref:RelA/SpoT domain-containing protein n=1 Tax=Fonsecaea monophora TaxID=254056 RepID=A0A177F1A6_9EURO|nr:hypothetical protein AYO21_08475 [Fonsecaea monophora]OAG37290.1 hypothetical protein AYO21_08475 [Fonsecaea monophora]
MESRAIETGTGAQLADQTEGPVINKFLEEYTRGGYLAYGKLTRLAKTIVRDELSRRNIKHELFDRGSEGWDGGGAKTPNSARRTILRRQAERTQRYEKVEEIERDMHDLAGIRIALYYPNDFSKVEEMITERFEEVKAVQDWPDSEFGPHRYPSLDADPSARTDISGRKSRFLGYFARHYRVQLKPKDDDDDGQSAVKDRVLEIQLMSLLMHTWSKMHHELIYKPQEGLPQVDEDDERLVDVSNGIIIAGEQLLRHIQISLDRKKARGSLPFENEEDFLSYLRQWRRKRGFMHSYKQYLMTTSGYNMDGILYRSLRAYGLNTREKVNWLLEEDDSRTRESGHLLITLANSAWFENLEASTLRLPKSNRGSPSRRHQTLDRDKATRLVRYYAWLISSALRWQNQPAMVFDEYAPNNDSLPSGEDFLQILHPKSQALLKADTVACLRNYCEHLFVPSQSDWMLSLALSRLTWYPIPPGLEKNEDRPSTSNTRDESEFTICPKYFVDILDRMTHDPTTHDPTTHGPTTHDPTTHGPTTHGPTTHDPTTHDPTTHDPTMHGRSIFDRTKPHALETVLLPLDSVETEAGECKWREYEPQGKAQRACIVGLERVRDYLDRPNVM